jgi:hypothetical protein
MKCILATVLLLLALPARAEWSNWCVEVSVSGGVYRVEHPLGWFNLPEVTEPDQNPATGLFRVWVTQQDYPRWATNGVSQATLSNAISQVRDRVVSAQQGKAVLKALIKVINLRLPVGQKITAEELKAAIKEELN